MIRVGGVVIVRGCLAEGVCEDDDEEDMVLCVTSTR